MRRSSRSSKPARLLLILVAVLFALAGCNLDDTAELQLGDQEILDAGPDVQEEDVEGDDEGDLEDDDEGDLEGDDEGDLQGDDEGDLEPDPTCDDEILNGEETDVDCGGPDCDPCDVGESCLEYTDCPEPEFGDWGECVYESECALTGTRSRVVTFYICDDEDRCAVDEEIEETHEGCDRDTQGQTCGIGAVSDWSDCTYNSSCTNTGSRSRQILNSSCNAGSCAPNPPETEIDTDGCDRDTDGHSCGDAQCSDWSDCLALMGSCSGTTSRSCTTFTCSDQICDDSSSFQSLGCTVDAGASCSCPGDGDFTYSGSCDGNGGCDCSDLPTCSADGDCRGSGEQCCLPGTENAYCTTADVCLIAEPL